MARFARLLGCLCGGAILSTAAVASAEYVRGTGRVIYFQSGAAGGPTLPLVGARVSLWDDDGIFDDENAEGYLDSNGSFDLSGSASDGVFGGKPDPYIEIELQSNSGHLVVESEILKINVTCATASRNSTAGTINFGTIACNGDARDGSTIFANLKRAYDGFRSLSGDSQVPRHGGKAAVLFPATFAAGVPWTTEESVHWPGGYRRFEAAFHEFGHRIRHAQDGDFVHFLGDVASFSYMQQHWATKVTNNGFAFNEGWAEYYAAANNVANYANWTPVTGGDSVEGNVSANLWKAHANCGGFAKLWNILKTGNIHSWPQFSTRLIASVQGDADFRSRHPMCLSTLTGVAPAAARPTRIPRPLAVPTNVADGTNLATAPKAQPAMGPAAIDQGVAVIDQQRVLMALGASAQSAAKNRKYKAPFVEAPGLKESANKLVDGRQKYESAEADKLAAYAAKLTPIAQTKEAVDQRQVEHAAFVNEVLADGLKHVESQLDELYAQRKKFGAKGAKGSKELPLLEKTIARLEARRDAFRDASKTGKMTRNLMPSSFKAAAEFIQDAKP